MLDLNIALRLANGRCEVEAASPEAGEVEAPRPGPRLHDLEKVRAEAARLKHQGATELEAVRLGRRVFDHLFDAETRRLYDRSLERAKARAVPLRVVLKLERTSALHDVPWEILHDGERSLARGPGVVLARYLRFQGNLPPVAVEPPLRVLWTSANPAGTEPLDLKADEASARAAFEGNKLVEVTFERDVSLDRLERLFQEAASRSEPFHLWHHAGHGGRSELSGEDRFLLRLQGEGPSRYATVDQLQEIAASSPELRLVVLAVCHGAAAVGLAPALALSNVPVVIGFPTRVYDSAAVRFSTVLHHFLLDLPVEEAVAFGRRSIKVFRPGTLDWAQPLLFSRRADTGPLLPKRVLEPPPQATHGSGPEIVIKGGHIGRIGTVGARLAGTAPWLAGAASSLRVRLEDTDVEDIGVVGVNAEVPLSPEQASQTERLRSVLQRVEEFRR